ncbi:MAG: hypothetical protein LC113_06560 [Acidobacteria bacterium]|nr:hypothetical protein [Acidobacteriota bacterium]
MKIVIDMNLSPDWVTRLAKGGIDAIHWSSVGTDLTSCALITIDDKRSRLRILPLRKKARESM